MEKGSEAEKVGFITAGELIEKSGLGKTTFYKRCDELSTKGYDMAPDKSGRNVYYSEYQSNVLLKYINHLEEEEGEFPDNSIVLRENQEIAQNEAGTPTTSPEEKAGESVGESGYFSLDQQAQQEAATREVLVDFYRATGSYTVPGLREQISEAKTQIGKDSYYNKNLGKAIKKLKN